MRVELEDGGRPEGRFMDEIAARLLQEGGGAPAGSTCAGVADDHLLTAKMDFNVIFVCIFIK